MAKTQTKETKEKEPKKASPKKVSQSTETVSFTYSKDFGKKKKDQTVTCSRNTGEILENKGLGKIK